MRTRNKLLVYIGQNVFGLVATVVFSIVATTLFFACSKDKEADTYNPVYAESRTVMVYMVAENSLGGYNLTSDMKELIMGMKNNALHRNDRLVVYVDDNSFPRIYVLSRNVNGDVMGDLQPVYTYEENRNSSSAEQLAQFVEYTKNNYPADSYGLVMWSHASGWIPSSYKGDAIVGEAGRRSFGIDNGKNSYSANLDGNQMNIDDMARALTEKGGVDFILFDACFMQGVEVAYELRNATKYIIGSPAEIPGPGADYCTMVGAMFRKEDYPEQMLAAYYNKYSAPSNAYGIVVALVNTAALTDFATYMKQLVAEKHDVLLAADYSGVQNYFRYGKWGTLFPDYYDMQGVMKKVLSEAEFVAWQKEVAKVVLCQHTDYWYTNFGRSTYTVDAEQCCGMSMFLPLNKYTTDPHGYNVSFFGLEWAKDVWKE